MTTCFVNNEKSIFLHRISQCSFVNTINDLVCMYVSLLTWNMSNRIHENHNASTKRPSDTQNETVWILRGVNIISGICVVLMWGTYIYIYMGKYLAEQNKIKCQVSDVRNCKQTTSDMRICMRQLVIELRYAEQRWTIVYSVEAYTWVKKETRQEKQKHKHI